MLVFCTLDWILVILLLLAWDNPIGAWGVLRGCLTFMVRVFAFVWTNVRRVNRVAENSSKSLCAYTCVD